MLTRFLMSRDAAATRAETTSAVRANRFGELLDEAWSHIPFVSTTGSHACVAAGIGLVALGSQAVAWTFDPQIAFGDAIGAWLPLALGAGPIGALLALYGILGGHRARARARSRAHHPAGKAVRADG